MRILVSGGSGLVGRHLVRDLSQDNAVTVLDLRNPSDGYSNFVRADVLSLSSLTEAVQEIDAIVHLAGIPHPLNDPPEKVFQVNTVGTFNLLEAAALAGIRRFVFLSSESTLGFAFARTRMWPEYVPIDEFHPLRPQDPYALSKVSGEMLCASYARTYGMQTISLRAPWIWVPEPKERELYRKLIAEFERWPRNLWAFIHVADVCRAIRCALTVEELGEHEAFFIAAAEQWTDVPTRALLRRFYPEVAAEKADVPGRASLLSGEKARRVLGFSPQHDRDSVFA